jgi:hypothetical protein
MTNVTAPDWNDAVELACPLCAYSLRGLTDPRCPECGFAFTWAELLDAKRDQHPWLFEHGRGWSGRRFVGTWARAALPWRFWRAVTPANPVRVGRLLAYWLLASLPLVAILFARLPGQVLRLASRNMDVRERLARSTPAGTAARQTLDGLFPAPWSFAFAGQAAHLTAVRLEATQLAAVGVAVAWPWLSLAALLLFQASMRRAQVRPAHVLRAAVYGCDFGLLMALFAAVVYSPVTWTQTAGIGTWPRSQTIGAMVPSGPFTPRAMPPVLVTTACAAAATVRLWTAYGRYLRFHRPFLTVLAAQIIALLSAVMVLSWIVRLV